MIVWVEEILLLITVGVSLKNQPINQKTPAKMEILILAYSMYHFIAIFEWLLPGMFFFPFFFHHTSIHVFCVHRSGTNIYMMYCTGV